MRYSIAVRSAAVVRLGTTWERCICQTGFVWVSYDERAGALGILAGEAENTYEKAADRICVDVGRDLRI
jgi:hypothetical protein